MELWLHIFKDGFMLASLVGIIYHYRRRQWHPTPVLLPGKSHGRRSLVGYSPWGCQELDTTEPLHFHFSLSCIGEGNGNPLQCSLAWRIPATGEPGGLPSMGSPRVGHDWGDLAAAAAAACWVSTLPHSWSFWAPECRASGKSPFKGRENLLHLIPLCRTGYAALWVSLNFRGNHIPHLGILFKSIYS